MLPQWRHSRRRERQRYCAALGERNQSSRVIVVNLDRHLLAYRALMPLFVGSIGLCRWVIEIGVGCDC
jgi:hypothetical protein